MASGSGSCISNNCFSCRIVGREGGGIASSLSCCRISLGAGASSLGYIMVAFPCSFWFCVRLISSLLWVVRAVLSEGKLADEDVSES